MIRQIKRHLQNAVLNHAIHIAFILPTNAGVPGVGSHFFRLVFKCHFFISGDAVSFGIPRRIDFFNSFHRPFFKIGSIPLIGSEFLPINGRHHDLLDTAGDRIFLGKR